MTHRSNRRQFLQLAGVGAAALTAGTDRAASAAPAAKVPYQLGMASYTFASSRWTRRWR